MYKNNNAFFKKLSSYIRKHIEAMHLSSENVFLHK